MKSQFLRVLSNIEAVRPITTSPSCACGPLFQLVSLVLSPFMVLVVGLLFGLLQSQVAFAVTSLTIKTSSGPATGLINGTTPNVAQFLGIPYAEPPVGSRRWLPAIAAKKRDRIDATRFGWSCPQFEGNGSSVWLNDVPETVTPPNTFNEDCLFVNVWAPWQEKKSKDLLPVIAWIHGGAFKTGGGNIEYQIPSRWVERTQKHIVIGIKSVVSLSTGVS